MGQALSVAAIMGIDTCAMEGIIKSEFDKYLGLESTNYTSCMAMAFGYRSADDKTQEAKKVRFKAGQLFDYRA